MSQQTSTSEGQKLPPLTFGQRIVSGGVAGVSELLVMYPLDVIKTRSQLHVGVATGQKSTLGQVAHVFRTEGLGTYRGIIPPILMETPKRALKFASNEAFKPYFTDNSGKLGQLGAAMAGICAGITETFVVVPFELVKVRLQDATSRSRYKGPVDVVLQVLRKEGPLGLYTGFEATLWRHAVWNGGYFGLIFTVRKQLPPAQSEKGQLFNNFVAGGLAGAFGTLLNTPTDVVKSRIQNSTREAGVVTKYNWLLPGLATVAREEGVRALFKGFVPKVMRLGPGGGILLVVFDYVSRKLQLRTLEKQQTR